ncbi:MAG: glycyl-radical enzyme activating protein [Dehalococcoidales bacterium]|nr:glycyl-radical enzyme activating protein [Dehalococcoidales bacterium]
MATLCNELIQNARIQDDARGIVFNIQRYSIQDGPGIRTTVFLKGCPLRCLWCSNPESQNVMPEVVHRDTLCNSCGRCLEVCREKAISIKDKTVSIDRKLCNNCGQCLEVCTPGALNIYGKTMSVREVFEQVRKDTDFYSSSGGGVTVSGGEPLSQPDFVAALFKLCQDRGIDTCIETSGCASEGALEKVLPLTSLVLYDIKLSDRDAHKKWTGQPNSEILRNLGLVVASGVPVIIRIPLIPGINDTEGELRKIAQIAVDNLKSPRKVNILPYHRFGMGKYQMLDRKYHLAELTTQKDPEISKMKELLESYDLECEIVL